MKYRGIELVWYKNNWYHPNFFTHRRDQCIRKAKGICQHCKVPYGGWYITKEGRLDRAVIQACHVNHDPWNPRAKLIALCKQCHLRYDAPMHGVKSSNTKKRNKSRENREREKEIGQKVLQLKNSRRGRPQKEQLSTLVDNMWTNQINEKRAMSLRKYKEQPKQARQEALWQQ